MRVTPRPKPSPSQDSPAQANKPSFYHLLKRSSNSQLRSTVSSSRLLRPLGSPQRCPGSEFPPSFLFTAQPLLLPPPSIRSSPESLASPLLPPALPISVSLLGGIGWVLLPLKSMGEREVDFMKAHCLSWTGTPSPDQRVGRPVRLVQGELARQAGMALRPSKCTACVRVYRKAPTASLVPAAWRPQHCSIPHGLVSAKWLQHLILARSAPHRK